MVASPSPRAKLIEVRRKSFRDQAVWFLNSCDAADSPEKCDMVRRLSLQAANAPSNSDLEESVVDEFTAHRLLEFSNKPCTR